ncbi:MAG: hypothetical protein DHS20C15_19600 [Planctomycetota bacterium]|nr:MAG: hypothetical protein DHS20C15_19600 [Planctomycetota bacterium]
MSSLQPAPSLRSFSLGGALHVALLLSACLLPACGDDAPRDEPARAATPSNASDSDTPPEITEQAKIKSSEWWQRAEEALSRVEDPGSADWYQAYFALCLERLDREAEAEARLAQISEPLFHAFALERLTLHAWRKRQTARFERLLGELTAVVDALPDANVRVYHHGLLLPLQLAAGLDDLAEASWYVSRKDPEPSEELREEYLIARLNLLAGLGREDDWRATWAQRYEQPPEILDLAPLLRGLLFVGEVERVTTLLEASLVGALGDAGARPKNGLFPAQHLVADWARNGFADKALLVFDALEANHPWPTEPAPPAELGEAMAHAERPTEAQSFAERLPPLEAARVYVAVAVALEEAGAGSAADALLERVDLIEGASLRARRLIARAGWEATPEARRVAVDTLLEVGDKLPATDRDLLGRLVDVLHTQGDREQLERVVDQYATGFREAQTLPTLAALTAGVGLDDRLFRTLETVFAEDPEPRAMLFALAAVVARNGHQAEMPPVDIGLRVDEIVAVLGLEAVEAAPR